MNSIKQVASELFDQGMTSAQALEELTKRGMKAKKSTLDFYRASRNKGEKKTSAKVVKAGAEKTATRIRAAQKTRQSQATRGLTQSDVIDWVYTNTNLVASKRRQITDLILN